MDTLDISTQWEDDGSLIKAFANLTPSGMEEISIRKTPYGMISIRVDGKTVMVLSQVELRTLRRMLFEVQS